MTKYPLLVHLVFHPASSNSRKLAIKVVEALNEDYLVQGLHIPTIFCIEDSEKPPQSQDLNQADNSFVIVFADDDMNNDDDWCDFVANLWEQCEHSNHCWIPFQLTENAWPLSPRLNAISFISAYSKSGKELKDYVIHRIVVGLCQYLHGDSVSIDSNAAPTKLFLSHTKMDFENEPHVVENLKKYFTMDQPIKTWFDSGDIPGGSNFAKKIEEGIEDASLLCVLTDNYASREWCRKEVLLAKKKQRPIVVIDALIKREVRSFPYLGNLPVIRWNNNPEDTIFLLLKETLMFLYNQRMLDKLKQAKDVIFTKPPELLTIIGFSSGTSIIYPDPPLGTEETQQLSSTGVNVSTPLQRISKNKSLKEKRIAISMSESTDITNYGFDLIHLVYAITELTRYLLIKGATIVYGGHLGDEGYTQKLIELVRTHNSLKGIDPVSRIENYIGWPIPFDKKLKSKYKFMANLIKASRPNDIDEKLSDDFKEEPSFFSDEKSPLHRYAWARGMTEMRKVETKATDARIVLGSTFGPTLKSQVNGSIIENWYKSRIPGVLEEVLLSIEANQPIFLIGAFGGVARLVIDIIEGKSRKEMTWDYQKKAPFAEEIRSIYESNNAWIDYPEMINQLRNKSITGVNRLLSEADHRELFYTKNVFRIVELIVKGLDRL